MPFHTHILQELQCYLNRICLFVGACTRQRGSQQRAAKLAPFGASTAVLDSTAPRQDRCERMPKAGAQRTRPCDGVIL